MEPLNKPPTADDGSFPPILWFEKREIHTVFHRFSNLVLTKNLSPSTAADLIRASLYTEAVRCLCRREFQSAAKLLPSLRAPLLTASPFPQRPCPPYRAWPRACRSRSVSSSQPSWSAPRWMISREQPAANFLSLYFFLSDFSSMSFVLLLGRISAAAQIRPVSSSAAKSAFSISCSGLTSTAHAVAVAGRGMDGRLVHTRARASAPAI